MKLLLISPYPPTRDGLASYAAQIAAAYRADGHQVEVLSPEPSAGRYHARLKTLRGLAQAAQIGRQADRVVVQFHPEIFFAGAELGPFARGWAALLLFFRYCGNVEVVVHETPYRVPGRTEALRQRMWSLLWQQPARVVVHTERERSLMQSTFGVDDSRLQVLHHGASFRRRSALTRDEARRSLDLEPGTFTFLCAGFLQPHKGFDRAAEALRRLDGPLLRLHVVGEMRVWTPEHEEYVQLLRAQAKADPRITVHDRYVSDEEFDRWLVASDSVVLPYREIWSSGVVERAALYGRPVIVTDVGGLAEQAAESGRVVRDADELVAVMAEVSGAEVLPHGCPTAGGPTAGGPTAGGPTAGGPTERASALVRERGEVLRMWHDPLDRTDRPTLDLPDGRVRDVALALPPVPTDPGVKTLALRIVRKLTGWELEPIVRYVNALRSEVLQPTDTAGGHDPAES